MQKKRTLCLVALVVCLPLTSSAQEKQRFATMDEAAQAGAILAGRQGPRNVNWIEGGKRFSFIDRDPGTNTPVIRSYDPATGRDTLLFRNTGLTFPGTNQPFSYDSFEWAQDSKHLVFQSNFQPLYRRSGISDFYVYSLADRSMQLATKGARTGELSPNGAMLGFERGGDMYVTNLATHQEKRLTRDSADHVFNVGSGQHFSIAQIAQEMARVLNKPHIEPEIVGRCRVGDIRNCFADISKARDILGYEPQVSLEDGLEVVARQPLHRLLAAQ